MKKLILHIYDWLSVRKRLTIFLMAIILGLCALSALRMHYEEDISAFLPQSEESKRYSEVYNRLGQDRMAVFFESETEDPDRVMDAMTAFGNLWAEADTAALVPDLQVSADAGAVEEVFGFIRAHWPYFLKEADYVRMDSLLTVPGYVEERMAENGRSFYSMGSSFTSQYLRSDPLGLFSPVLRRLEALNPTTRSRVEDGFLFTGDGRTGVVLFNSPFGSTESGRNADLKALTDTVKARTAAQFPDLRITSTGGPEVAVENASRIKKDSFLALALAAILICIVLWLSYKRFTDVFWILVSILAGALFALGIIALFKSSVSLIVLGIGSMIIGIAVNYPLHYVDHLKYQPDKRKALADQVNPLLVGNITTVGAFLSLLLLKAEALHDFGFIGAMMLVGTILFVLVFLPVLVPAASRPRNTVKLDFDRHLHLAPRARKWVFIGFLAVTAVLFWLSRGISFDADMHHINYMTPEQERGFALLEEMGASADGASTVYVVASGATAEEALQCNEALQSVVCANASVTSTSSATVFSGLGTFLPSKKEQAVRLARWNAFREAQPDLSDRMIDAGLKAGFTAHAFQPFFDVWDKDWTVQEVDYFAPITGTLGAAMYLEGEDKVQVVNYLKMGEISPLASLGRNDKETAVEALRARLPEGAFCFRMEDVSGTLARMLSEDFDRIGFLCSVIVLFFLCLSLGMTMGITAFLPLAVGWIWILGTMRLFGLQFNIVNIILATFIFGQGDDYSIFITEGLMYEYATGKKILRSFKNAVVLSALIMFIGIGALIVAKHPALRSLAAVTIVGMFTVVAMAYYLPPLVFRFLTTKKGQPRKIAWTLGRSLRTGYIFVVFLLAMLGLSVWTFFLFLGGPTPRKREKYRRGLMKTARLAMKAIPGCPYTLSNPHGEDFSKPAMYICNHQSHFDVLPILALHPKVILLTNEWVWNSPFYGYLIRKAEFYPVMEGLEKNLAHMKDLVARGYSIVIFPEGTRSPDCRIQRFHRGAFVSARELGLPILPLYIHGFGYALPKHDFLLRKAGLYMEIGERFEVPEGDVAAFTRKVRHDYEREYARIRRERETAAYNATYVRYQYLYKGHDADVECRRVLAPETIARVDALTGTELTVNEAGCGVYTLLVALTHPDMQVTAYEADDDKYLTAVRCAGVPENLTYICGKCEDS
ncbi:MAG: 1-acyl-sn-glycerol-3-phosphate acyltransferase [Bacteroidales bacterium]|nr:1-acyl-sn-glycerol-3-phosphate acyltransferase [Bacteroidales bacterium]